MAPCKVCGSIETTDLGYCVCCGWCPALPDVGDVLATGTLTHDGTPNVCRVIRHGGISDGFYAVFVNPWRVTELRISTDREFFVWRGSRDHRRMEPYRGFRTPPVQPQLLEA